MPAKELKIKTTQLIYAAKAWGPVSGVPVLAVHGWQDNAASFDRLAPLLEGVRLVALDLPGHGRSEHRRGYEGYHLIDWVADIRAVVDRLGWDRFVLMGHSMGAAASILFSGTYPSRVQKLILFDTIGPFLGKDSDLPNRLGQYVDTKLRYRSGRQRSFKSIDEAAKARQKHGLENFESAKILMTRALKRSGSGYLLRTDSKLLFPTARRFKGSQIQPFIDQIKSPVLLLKTKRLTESKYYRDYSKRLSHLDRLSRAKVDGSHHFHLERPLETAGYVNRFLKRGRL